MTLIKNTGTLLNEIESFEILQFTIFGLSAVADTRAAERIWRPSEQSRHKTKRVRYFVRPTEP